jgi:hypothetical protein
MHIESDRGGVREGGAKMNRLIKAAFPVIALAVFLFLLFVALTRGQENEIVASGGAFTLEKASIAGGGRDKQQSTFAEHGTTAQAVAGARSNGGPYSLYSGFWTPDDFAPTAAGVNISGRIATSDGSGVRNVAVSITFPSGEIRNTLSSSMGYYVFADIPAGHTYIITVNAKRYMFDDPVRVRHVVDELTDVDFVATPID